MSSKGFGFSFGKSARKHEKARADLLGGQKGDGQKKTREKELKTTTSGKEVLQAHGAKPAIPLLKRNKWYGSKELFPPALENEADASAKANTKSSGGNDVAARAAQMVLARARAEPAEEDDGTESGLIAMAANRVPGIEHARNDRAKYKMDIEQRPNEENINYSAMPVDGFGLKLLRGMGFDEDSRPQVGRGHRAKVVKAVVPNLRGYRQGLGADKVNPRYVKSRRRPRKPGEKERPNALPPKKPQKRKTPDTPGPDVVILDGSTQSPSKQPPKRRKIAEETPLTWVKNNCRVRIVASRHGQHHYCKKGIVQDLISSSQFTVLMDSGAMITVPERDVETYIPKVGQQIIVVRGELKGLTGSMMHKDKKTSIATIKSAEDLQIHRLSYNDICAYQNVWVQ